MPKPLKIALLVAGSVIALAAIALAIIAATFDPNDYKPQLIQLVQQKTQRTLSIPGDIRLSVFPKLGANLGAASLSQRNSTEEFAAVKNATLSLALWPMLKRQFNVDRVTVDGLRVNLHKFKDGSTNIDDLLKPGGKDDASQPVQFDIDGIVVNDAALSYHDEQAGRNATLTDLDMRTGPIAEGRDSTIELTGKLADRSTQTSVGIDLRSGMTLHLADQRYVVRDLKANVTGTAMGFDDLRMTATAGNADLRTATSQFALEAIELALAGKQAARSMDIRLALPKLALTAEAIQGSGLNGAGKITEGPRTIDVKLTAPAFQGSPKAFDLAAVTLDATVSEPGLQANARASTPLQGNLETLLFRAPQLAMTLDGKQGDRPVKGSVHSAVTADLGKQRIDAGNLAINFQLPHPQGGTMAFQANGDASADLEKQSARAALKGSLDGAALDVKLGVRQFSRPEFDVEANIAALDVDRYLAGDKQAPAKQAGTGGSAPAGTSKPEEKPIDLSALKTLNATAKLQIGSLKVSGLKASNINLTLRAVNGKADINPLSANLYGGSLSGALSAAAAEQPRFTIRQTLSGVQIGPLLKDLMDKEILDGRGRVIVDVSTTGATVAALKKALAGSAQLSLQDGAIRGVNIPGAIRQAKARLGVGTNTANVSDTGTPAAVEKTDFTELTGSFRIVNGVARNDDLEAKSPLLRITGAGNVDIGADRIDYLLKATVVSTLKGQGGPELQALRGVTVPVRLTGPYDAIAWNIDVAGMASELAKAKVEEKKAEVQAEVQKQIGEQRGKIEEEVRGRLKGLLGQ